MEGSEPPNVYYLVNLYAEASGTWDEFRATGNEGALLTTAETLCQGLRRLHEDESFWRELYVLEDADEQQRAEVFEQLQDVDAFFAGQYETISSIASEAVAVRLLADLGVAIDAVEAWPGHDTIDNLRRRANDLQVAICAIPENHEQAAAPKGERLLRGVRIAARGVLFAAGGALCAADILTAHGVVHVAPSLIKGSGAMVKAVSRRER